MTAARRRCRRRRMAASVGGSGKTFIAPLPNTGTRCDRGILAHLDGVNFTGKAKVANLQQLRRVRVKLIQIKAPDVLLVRLDAAMRKVVGMS